MRKFIPVFFGFASLLFLRSNAQQFSLYHSNTLVDAFNNPSHQLFKDTCKKWASNFFIPAFNFNTTLKGPANVIIQGGIKGQELNFSGLQNGKKRYNELEFITDIDLFLLKFRLSKKRRDEVSLGFQARSYAQVTFKDEFFNLIQGNNTFAGERLDGFLNTNSGGTAYASASLGYRSHIIDKFSGGFKFSLLNGIANQTLTIEDSYLFTEQNGEYIDVGLTGTYYSSFRTDGDNNTSANIMNDFMAMRNKGYALSMGVDYEINDKAIVTATVKDIGSIWWNRANSSIYTLNKTVRFDGYPALESEQVRDSIADNLGKFTIDTAYGGYSTDLPGRIEISSQYKVANWYRPSLIISKKFENPSVDFAILNDVVLLKTLHLIPILSFNTNQFIALGGEVLFQTKGMDFYFGSEKFVNTYTVMNYNGNYMPAALDFNFGMAFKVGHCKEQPVIPVAKDSDLDGLPDSLDNCPNIAGPRENRGCPYADTDADGVLDTLDQCPTIAGPPENKGCPYSDTDGDGLLDKDDLCPTLAGPVENKGCPYNDTDLDGVIDEDDKCPALFGPVGNSGCPYPDMDGDSVIDLSDQCPTIPGTVANNGCPEEPKKVVLTREEQEVINKVFKNLTFATGKAIIQPSSYPALNGLMDLLYSKPSFKVLIEGHTDNTGSLKLNEKLSQDRANAVKKYLINKGIETERIIAVGYGPSRPVANNATAEGRARNRRVEFTIIE